MRARLSADGEGGPEAAAVEGEEGGGRGKKKGRRKGKHATNAGTSCLRPGVAGAGCLRKLFFSTSLTVIK